MTQKCLKLLVWEGVDCSYSVNGHKLTFLNLKFAQNGQHKGNRSYLGWRQTTRGHQCTRPVCAQHLPLNNQHLTRHEAPKIQWRWWAVTEKVSRLIIIRIIIVCVDTGWWGCVNELNPRNEFVAKSKMSPGTDRAILRGQMPSQHPLKWPFLECLRVRVNIIYQITVWHCEKSVSL